MGTRSAGGGPALALRNTRVERRSPTMSLRRSWSIVTLMLVTVTGCGSGSAVGTTPSPVSGRDGGASTDGADASVMAAGGSPGGSSGGASGASGQPRQVPDASGSPRLCSDLFDQTIISAYSFEISAADWAQLDADFHDIKDVLAGTPPQTYYPVVFHYGAETVSNAAVRLRGKSSWVDTVMFDANPKMQVDLSFDQVDSSQKFHGVSTIHLEMPRDDWTFLNDRIGNNWFREIGLMAPCSNSAMFTINGAYYGL